MRNTQFIDVSKFLAHVPIKSPFFLEAESRSTPICVPVLITRPSSQWTSRLTLLRLTGLLHGSSGLRGPPGKSSSGTHAHGDSRLLIGRSKIGLAGTLCRRIHWPGTGHVWVRGSGSPLVSERCHRRLLWGLRMYL